MTERLRVAIVSHGHPELSPGGAERASYSLFRDLQDAGDFEAFYVAGAPALALGHSGNFARFRGRERELQWHLPPVDVFRMSSIEPDRLRRQAIELFGHIRPDVVHLHHYVHTGLELLRILREELHIPVVLTLHEYLLICNNHGQMIKTDGSLCYEAYYADCAACFPERTAGKFFLRKQLIMEFLAYVDRFIAPSEFLAGRYADWGIDRDRISVIENPLRIEGLEDQDEGRGTEQSGDDELLRLGFFGQLNPFKGVDVLLDAMELLDDDVRQRVRLTIHGANLDIQAEAFQARVRKRLEDLDDCVVVAGRYRNDDVVALMRSVDWVVVPSIWWENSPVVIQEARAAGVPVLCSNIGGMKEKVRDGIDGAHFMVGNSADLAARITAIAGGRLSANRSTATEQPSSPVADIEEVYRFVQSRNVGA